MAVHAPSAIGFNQPSVLVLPVPQTGAQQDLQQVAYSYAGFAVGAIVPGRVSRVLTLWPVPSALTLRQAFGNLTLWPSPAVLKAGDE